MPHPEVLTNLGDRNSEKDEIVEDLHDFQKGASLFKSVDFGGGVQPLLRGR